MAFGSENWYPNSIPFPSLEKHKMEQISVLLSDTQPEHLSPKLFGSGG